MNSVEIIDVDALCESKDKLVKLFQQDRTLYNKIDINYIKSVKEIKDKNMRYEYYSTLINDKKSTDEDNNSKVDKMSRFSHDINKKVKNWLNEFIDTKCRAKIQSQHPPRTKNNFLQEQAQAVASVSEIAGSNKRPARPPPPARIINNACSLASKLSIDFLSLNDIKQIIKVNDFEFEHEKLENIFILLPQDEYDCSQNSWLDAFSISEIIQNFYPNNQDIYTITIEQLKKRIGSIFTLSIVFLI